MSRTPKKTIAAITGAALAVAVAGVAFAYWTGSGSGTGTAATGTSAAGLVAHQTSTVTNMRPGDLPQTLSGNFDNANDGPVYVTTVTASIGTVVKAVGAPSGTCTAADYALTGAVMTVNAEVATGLAKGTWTGATIQFENSAANQDACKGATVNLAYTIG